MRREQRLLERVAAAGASLARGRYETSATDDLEGRMESIRHYLTRLLNARQGMCETAPDFGLPALTQMLIGSGDHVQAVQEAIRNTIERYEPRLRRVRVTHQAEASDRQNLVFRVDAVMVGRNGEHRVWYETSFAPSGEAQVSG